jgi:Tol biopolymer transport system component
VILTPEVSGDRVVFAAGRIMLTNITTGSTIRLTNQNDAILPVSELRYNQNPWIDGDKIVWTEHAGGSCSGVSGGKIVLLNLTTGKKEYVPAGMPGNQSYPRISGNFIIWRDYRGNRDSPDLYLMDIRNGTEMRLVSSVRGIPFIQGDSVFWEEKNSMGIDTIVRYTISSGTRSDIGPGCMGQTQAISPVSDDRIVWRVSRSPSNMREVQGAIMVMDLRTGEKSQITSFEKGVSFPVISGDRIVYTRGAGDDWFKEPREVVLYTLAAPRPSTITTLSGTGIDDNNTQQPSAQYSGVQTGATPAAPAGLPGMVSIAGVMAGVSLWGIIRKGLRR